MRCNTAESSIALCEMFVTVTWPAAHNRAHINTSSSQHLQVGIFIQHSSTFVSGFVIAFVKGWDMTLVLVGCLPFLAGVGAVLAKLTTSLTNKMNAAYTEVGFD